MHNNDDTPSNKPLRKRDTYHHYLEQTVTGRNRTEHATVGLGLDSGDEASDLEPEHAPIGLGLDFGAITGSGPALAQAPIGLGLGIEEKATGSGLEPEPKTIIEPAMSKAANLPPHRPDSAFLRFDFAIASAGENVDLPNDTKPFVSRFDPWQSGVSQHANTRPFTEGPASFKVEMHRRRGTLNTTKPYGSKIVSEEEAFHELASLMPVVAPAASSMVQLPKRPDAQVALPDPNPAKAVVQQQADLMQVTEPPANIEAQLQKRNHAKPSSNQYYIPPFNPHKSASLPTPADAPAFHKPRAYHKAPTQKRDGMLLPKGKEPLSLLTDSAMDWQKEHDGEFSMRSPFENNTNGGQRNYNIPTITLKRASDVPRDSFTTEASGSPKAKKGKARLSRSPQGNILDDWMALEQQQPSSRRRPVALHEGKQSLREATFSTLVAERGDSPPLPPKPTSPSTTARLRRIKSKKRQSMPRGYYAQGGAGHLTWAVQRRPDEVEVSGHASGMEGNGNHEEGEWEEGSPPSGDADELGLDWEFDDDAVGVAY